MHIAQPKLQAIPGFKPRPAACSAVLAFSSYQSTTALVVQTGRVVVQNVGVVVGAVDSSALDSWSVVEDIVLAYLCGPRDRTF
jgi:hypothetical protein